MVDPVACAAMRLGEPRVSLTALRDLRDLLARRGVERSSPRDSDVAGEVQHGRVEEADRIVGRTV
jgi:hypothetical protein